MQTWTEVFRDGSLSRAAALIAALQLLGCASLPVPQLESALPTAAGSHTFGDFIAVIPERGESFASLAERHLGDRSRGWVIARYNGVASVEPGQRLLIPTGPFARGGLGYSEYQRVPVLSYHKFSETTADAMTVTRKDFEDQMALLKNEGYEVVTLDELFDFLDFRTGLPEKAAVITFDDGWRSMYDIAFPVLKRYGYPATLFVSTDMITGSRKTLSWELIREMQAEGISVQNHTVNHRDLAELKQGETYAEYIADLERELAAAGETIARNVGSKPKYIAYPYGSTSPLVVALASKLGYRGALTVQRGPNPFYVHNYRVNRSMVYGTFDLARFRKNLSTTGKRALR